MKDEKNKMDFESAFVKLEEIIRKLEDGNLSLEESLELFQEGVKLYKLCKEKLENAKLIVHDVLKEVEEDFEEILNEDSMNHLNEKNQGR